MSSYDITGKKFGYWTVLNRDLDCQKSYSKWICRCECGTIKSVAGQSLVRGDSRSCGCHRADNLKGINSTHGMSKTRLYHLWSAMRGRCNPSRTSATTKGYVDRGIAVCDEWKNSFESFMGWSLANGYADNLTIDRVNNNLGYSPDNCRWITIEEQQSNKRNTVYVTYNGKKRCLRTLCEEIGFPYKTAHKRLQKMKARNIPIDIEKLFEPIKTKYIPFRYRNSN